jgi:two-component system, OmpR family, sensor histidine kinase KdpD
VARGKLRIYLGAAPGVGKTYAMLDEGWRRKGRGTDVVIGYVESHNRPKTIAQIRDLEVVPRQSIEYRGQTLEEMDVDAVLRRKPAVALVDELAHSNVPGSRNEKRWQDVELLLEAGIDVISTVNVQHLASLNDVVEQIAGVAQRETVPDAIVRAAEQIELVDMAPEALRRRMAHGNIYPPAKVDAALAHYFRVGNLGALRELALLWVADRVDDELHRYRERHGIEAPWETKERVVVALTGAPNGDRLLRRGARMAARVNGELVGVHVLSADGAARPPSEQLERQRELLAELGGRYAELTAIDVAGALVAFARAENATQLVLGATQRSRVAELFGGSVINRAIREAADLDVHVISAAEAASGGLPRPPRRNRLATFPPRRRQTAWALASGGIVLLTFGLSPMRSSLALPGALLVLLLGVTAVAVVGGVPPAVLAAGVSVVVADYFFTPPYHSFRISHGSDVVALIVFIAAAAVVSALVDRLTRRGLQLTRSAAEAEALARLAGGTVLSKGEPLPDLVAELRRTFGLDAVAVLAPDDGGWRPIATAGGPVPARPEAASLSAELIEGTVLVLSGSMASVEDQRLLNVFVAQLRLAQERAALEARAASATELEEASTLRTALLAAVSHDLRTPLASIKAAATSLLSEEVAFDRDEERLFAKTIDDEADRLTHIVTNLLDMSRVQTGALKVALTAVPLADLVYRTIGTLSAGSSRVIVDIDESDPFVEADPGLLERVLANVIENALAWSPDGTVVRVEGAPVGDHVDVRVVDQGPGIPVDRREQVFEPFQRLGDRRRETRDGVGLGLAVARGFIDAMGGSIAIDDTPGGGTTVVCSLPRAAA